MSLRMRRPTLVGSRSEGLRRMLALAVLLLLGTRVEAQDARTTLELSFTPADRSQIAVWVERSDGAFMGTLALTHAVAVAGIGNRPGALQMNSGFRWPYGRREGVLPVWAHRRAQAEGARQFRRIIFQNRDSEGYASRSRPDQSVDDYYCLSFKRETTGRDALDAVTCASVFSSDKGRFMTETDVERGYAEPFENEQKVGSRRALSLASLYPPRRDVSRCTNPGCFDHPDVSAYGAHAREVMPELDAISRATPESERRVTWSLALPDGWSMDQEYVLYLEVNVEGDYNGSWGPGRFPTPTQPAGSWDSWSKDFGYPYRGQPSVVYALPFTLAQAGLVTARVPAGYGAIHGEDGILRPLDATITDDPVGAPGSGADRLRDVQGARATMRVLNSNPCAHPNPPANCGMSCSMNPDGCGALVCDPVSSTCQSYCTSTDAPGPVSELSVAQHPERTMAHMWARLSFRAADSERPIGGYDVRIKPDDGEWSQAYTHDSTESLLPVALDVCNDPANPDGNRCLAMQAGTTIAVDLANLKQRTRYSVSVTPRDAVCSEAGPEMLAQFETAERIFTTVSPCFIATAAYGSPLAQEVSVLRGVRDRYLASHAPGRALIRAYYELGPTLAGAVREKPFFRSAARMVIAPLVSISEWWTE
jgi:hypothetical protein